MASGLGMLAVLLAAVHGQQCEPSVEQPASSHGKCLLQKREVLLGVSPSRPETPANFHTKLPNTSSIALASEHEAVDNNNLNNNSHNNNKKNNNHNNNKKHIGLVMDPAKLFQERGHHSMTDSGSRNGTAEDPAAAAVWPVYTGPRVYSTIHTSSVLHSAALIVRSWSLILAAAVLVAVAERARRGEPGPATAKARTTDALSGLRFLLNFIVFSEHVGLSPHTIGGSTFLVLSACVISTSRRAENGRVKAPFNSMRAVGWFYVQRATRILPLVWFFRFVDMQNWMQGDPVQFIMGVVASAPQKLNNRFLPDFLFLSAHAEASHIWFVRCILALYIAYPAIELFIFRRDGVAVSRTWLFSLMGVCCLVKLAAGILAYNGLYAAGLYTLTSGSQWDFYTSPVLRLPEFVLGMVIPHVTMATLEEAPIIGRWLTWCADAGAFVLLLVIFILPQTEASRMFTFYGGHIPLATLVLWGLCFGPFQSVLGRALSLPSVVWLGELSFGVYVYHLHIVVCMGLWQLQPRGNGSVYPMADGFVGEPVWFWVGLPIAFAISFMLSWATKVLVEDKVQSAVKWLATSSLPSAKSAT